MLEDHGGLVQIRAIELTLELLGNTHLGAGQLAAQIRPPGHPALNLRDPEVELFAEKVGIVLFFLQSTDGYQKRQIASLAIRIET